MTKAHEISVALTYFAVLYSAAASKSSLRLRYPICSVESVKSCVPWKCQLLPWQASEPNGNAEIEEECEQGRAQFEVSSYNAPSIFHIVLGREMFTHPLQGNNVAIGIEPKGSQS